MYNIKYINVPIVTEKAAKIVKPLKPQKVKECSEAELTVVLDKPNQLVTWYRNGIEIAGSENYKVCLELWHQV